MIFVDQKVSEVVQFEKGQYEYNKDLFLRYYYLKEYKEFFMMTVLPIRLLHNLNDLLSVDKILYLWI